MAERTFRIAAELAGWLKAYCAETSRSYSSVAAEALAEYRDEAPSLEKLAQADLTYEVGSKLAPLQGREPRFIEMPNELFRWMQVYASLMGRSGDWVISQALTEYRSRVESHEPCTQGR